MLFSSHFTNPLFFEKTEIAEEIEATMLLCGIFTVAPYIKYIKVDQSVYIASRTYRFC